MNVGRRMGGSQVCFTLTSMGGVLRVPVVVTTVVTCWSRVAIRWTCTLSIAFLALSSPSYTPNRADSEDQPHAYCILSETSIYILQRLGLVMDCKDTEHCLVGLERDLPICSIAGSMGVLGECQGHRGG